MRWGLVAVIGARCEAAQLIPPQHCVENGPRRPLCEFFKAPVLPAQHVDNCLRMPDDARCRGRSSEPHGRFLAQENARLLLQHPRDIWFIALRLGGCPLPMVRRTLGAQVTSRRSRIVPPPFAHCVLISLCRHSCETEYQYR